jgi:hypothetical protein
MLSARTITRRLVVSRRWQHAHAPSTRPTLNSVTHEDVEHFSKILPASAILSTLSSSAKASTDDLEPFNTDWIGRYHGQATTVLKPQTTQQVSEIMRYCYDRKIGVVPQGGNTGLVGGSVPLKDELVISLGNMSKVRSFDPVSGEYTMAGRSCGIDLAQVHWLRMLDASSNLCPSTLLPTDTSCH